MPGRSQSAHARRSDSLGKRWRLGYEIVEFMALAMAVITELLGALPIRQVPQAKPTTLKGASPRAWVGALSTALVDGSAFRVSIQRYTNRSWASRLFWM